MRKTLLPFTTMALALVLAAGMAWAAPGPPTVVSTVPPTATPSPTGVDPTANIKAKFSEAMKERSINTTTFYLLPGGHFTYAALNCTAECVALPPPVAATVRYNDDTKTAVLDPTAALAFNTRYTAVVEGTADGDMKAVKDRGGTPLATDYIFYFTTGGGGPGGF
jgi:Bacterial Ig-like domain